MKRIFAIAGIVILISMYIISLILAFIDKSASSSWFMASIFCTVVIPILIWIGLRLYKWTNEKDSDQK